MIVGYHQGFQWPFTCILSAKSQQNYQMRTERNLPRLYLVLQQEDQYQKHIHNLHSINSRVLKGRPQHSFSEKLQEFKQKKGKDFMKRMETQKRRINQQNLKMNQRLAKVTFMVPTRLKSSSSSHSFNNTLSKIRNSEIHQENYNLFHRIMECNPSINAKRMNQQYIKTKRIREGLAKFDNNYQLKLKKYLRKDSLQNSRFSKRVS